jgi:hypothetical protein
MESPYTEQFNIGFARQLPNNMAIAVDFVARNRLHATSALAAALDLNLFNRSAARGGPVIRRCTPAEASNPLANCSNGPIQITQSIDRNQYKALLVKVDKRFSDRYQFTASYALSTLKGFFIGEDLTNWFGNPGPLGDDARHRFAFSGVIDLPWNFQASIISVLVSKGPFNARIPGTVDLNGDGTGGDTLPGLRINRLNRGVDRNELISLVNAYNSNVVLPTCNAANGQCGLRPLVLPQNFEFGDNFQSHDIRITKRIRITENMSIEAMGEVFNVFNNANLGGFSSTLDQGNFVLSGGSFNIVPPSSFNYGRPTLRVGQSFGTGGPRAFQFGGRFIF